MASPFPENDVEFGTMVWIHFDSLEAAMHVTICEFDIFNIDL